MVFTYAGELHLTGPLIDGDLSHSSVQLPILRGLRELRVPPGEYVCMYPLQVRRQAFDPIAGYPKLIAPASLKAAPVQNDGRNAIPLALEESVGGRFFYRQSVPAATFARVAVPEMRRHGYDLRLATGVVASGGTLGILIPPSIILIIYALFSERSVPEMYAAALFPGIALTLLHIAAIAIIARVQRGWVPKEPGVPLGARLTAATSLWKVALLFAIAVGGIYVSPFVRGMRSVSTAIITGRCRLLAAACQPTQMLSVID